MRELRTNERLDTGKTVRQRVHPGHQLELFVGSHSTVMFNDTCVRPSAIL